MHYYHYRISTSHDSNDVGTSKSYQSSTAQHVYQVRIEFGVGACLQLDLWGNTLIDFYHMEGESIKIFLLGI